MDTLTNKIMDERVIIGLGHKGRHGKDTFGSFLHTAIPDSKIIHFADPLKDEVSQQTTQPLIFRRYYNGKIHYFFRDHVSTYVIKSSDAVPFIHNIFEKRQINEYGYMAEKDPEILQFWGTNFRRAQDPDYWVNKLIRIILNSPEKYIIIPDVRFYNEYNYIKEKHGIYIDVKRFNSDGTLYLDPNRDPNHQSEVELDDAEADFVIKADSGDMDTLEQSVELFMNKFNELF